MRIAFVTHAYSPAVGGAERYAQGLAEALARDGHDVHVLTPARDSAEAFYEWGHTPLPPGNSELKAVAVHRLELSPRQSWWRPRPQTGAIAVPVAESMWRRYARAVEQEVSRLKPDATFTLPHAFPNVSAALGAPDRGITVYAPLLHEEDPAWDVDRIADLVSRSDIVVALTEWERERLTDGYRADATRTVVATPGIDSPDPDDVEEWKTTATYVLSLGRRAASKHLPEIARAVQNLRDEGTDIKYVVAGPGNDPEVDAELLGTGDAIEILGEIDEGTKWSLLKGSLATVSMSSRESFGIAAAESWRMRRPVVARRGPISDEVVQDGVTGLLVDNGADLERSLVQLYDNPPVAKSMGGVGFERSQTLTWESAIAPLVAALYAESS